LDQGFSCAPSTQLTKFSEYLNLFFELQVKTLIPDCDNFLTMCSNFVSLHTSKVKTLTPISLDKLRFISWDFAVPLKNNYHTFRHGVRLTQGTMRFSITSYANVLDKASMVTTFASIFTHSIEATALYYLFTNAADINDDLNVAGLPPILFFSNHDSVGVNLLYCLLLPSLFAHAYTTIAHMNFLTMLAASYKSPKFIRVDNPHFIKF
jgi:hypothetical protein